MHGDQTGRDGGTKKVKEENETLDDLQQKEDERGCFQPLWKMDTDAAERTPSRTASVLRRLDERRTDGDENRICEPPSPGLAALPFIFKPLGSAVGSTGFSDAAAYSARVACMTVRCSALGCQ